MSANRESRLDEPSEEQELSLEEEERQLRARMHRWLGMLAAILVLVAMGVAVWRINVLFGREQVGYSPLQALGLGMYAMPLILLILGLGVFFSLGTTRFLLLMERLFKRNDKKAGE